MRGDVVEEVGDDDVEQDGVGEDRRQVVRDVDADRSVPERRTEPVDDGIDDRPQLVGLEVGMDGTRCDPAEVEQAADEPVEAGGLRIDDDGRPTPGLVGPFDLRVGQPAGRRPDARKRRPKVVRDRVDEGGLEVVGLARDLELGGGLAELVAPQRQGHLVGGEGHDPRLDTRRVAARSVAQPYERAKVLLVDLDPGAVLRDVARRGPAPTLRQVGPNPVRRLVTGRPDQVRRDAGVRRRRTIAGVGEQPFGAGRPGHDPDALEAGRLAHPRRDLGRGLRGRRCGRQRSTEGEQRARLGRPPRGFVGAFALRRHETTHGQGHEQEQDEVEHLARIRDHEREPGFGEQEVVRHERGDGGDDGRDRAGQRTDDDDRDEVDGRGVVDPDGVALEDRDGRGRDGDRADDQGEHEGTARPGRGDAFARHRSPERHRRSHGRDGRPTRRLVLAAIPKYGLERAATHPYCLARSGPDPTPEYLR